VEAAAHAQPALLEGGHAAAHVGPDRPPGGGVRADRGVGLVVGAGRHQPHPPAGQPGVPVIAAAHLEAHQASATRHVDHVGVVALGEGLDARGCHGHG
jgi:hypothetical protein